MNVAESNASRPCHRDEAGKRIERIIKRMPVEKTLGGLAPFAAGAPAEAVNGMFSEAESMLGIALEILEWHVDGSTPGSWGSKVSDLVFLAKQRIECAARIHAELVADLASDVSDDAPASQTRPL